jgi:hypothetical protein
MSGDMRDTKGLDKKGLRGLQNQWEDRLGQPAKGTLRGGEVRLDGSAKGGDFVTGINNTPGTGRQSHSGKPSRVIGKSKNQSRSAEASAKSKETMEAVRRRAAVRRAAEQAMKAKKVKSRSIGNRARAKGTGETRRLTANKQQRLLRDLLQRLRGR